MRTMGKMLVCAVALSLPQLVTADATSDAKKAIQAAYNKANAAAEKKDVSGALANHAPDCVFIDQQGRSHDMGTLKTQLAQVFQVAKEIHSKTAIDSVSLKGNKATVKISEAGKMEITNPQTKQTAKLDIESKSEDVWMKTAQGWKLKQSKALGSKQWVNGKPFTPPQR